MIRCASPAERRLRAVATATALAAAALAALSGCNTPAAETFLSDEGGAGPAGSGGSGGAGDPAEAAYPTIASLYEGGVAKTCALNEGVCHSARQYPELGGGIARALDLVGAACQVAPADPALVPDECERPGDVLVLGGVDHEILRVTAPAASPVPSPLLAIHLADPVGGADAAGAHVRRLDANGNEVLSRSLDGAAFTVTEDPRTVSVDLRTALDLELPRFFDPRVTYGEHVRVGDPNGNGIAHASATPWSLVVPGHPERSFLYQRLVRDTFGPRMPLISRSWSPLATRAFWCWIRGLPEGATPTTIAPTEPIDYASCPEDPDAPAIEQKGWPAVRSILGSSCATASCHSAEVAEENLVLVPEPAVILGNVVGAAALQKPGVLRIAPGQPAASYLLCKIDPACEARTEGTSIMPAGTDEALGADEIATIADWIAAGAPVE